MGERHLGSPGQEDYVARLIFPQTSPRGLGNVERPVEVGSGARHTGAFTSCFTISLAFCDGGHGRLKRM